jgi:hypothetical protein
LDRKPNTINTCKYSARKSTWNLLHLTSNEPLFVQSAASELRIPHPHLSSVKPHGQLMFSPTNGQHWGRQHDDLHQGPVLRKPLGSDSRNSCSYGQWVLKSMNTVQERGDDDMSPALLHERTARNTTGFEVQLVDRISLSSPQPQQVPGSAQQSQNSTRVQLPSPAGSHTPAVSCPHPQLPTDRRSKRCHGSLRKHR